MKYSSLLLIYFLSPAAICAQSFNLEGIWIGKAQSLSRSEVYIRLNIKRDRTTNYLIGTLYDSSISSQRFSLSNVIVHILDGEKGKKFLVEGKELLKQRHGEDDYNNLSLLYLNMQSQDTIIARLAEQGNFVALLGDKYEDNGFPLYRHKVPPKQKHSVPKVPTPILKKDSAKEKPKTMFTVLLQDYDKEDGDVVRLFVNGKKVIDRLGTRSIPYRDTIYLNQYQNEITIESLSEGTIPPTTIYGQLLIDHKIYATFMLSMEKGERKTYKLINTYLKKADKK